MDRQSGVGGAIECIGATGRGRGARRRAGNGVPLWAAALVAACGAPVPPPSPEPLESAGLVRRHFDQVCHIETQVAPIARTAELFDTLGLAAELAALGAPALPPRDGGDATRWHTLDYISRYGRDGRLRLKGVWDTSLDSATAARTEEILTARARPLPGLLKSEGFRTAVVLSTRPSVTTASAVLCMPHIRHEVGQRPPGLPEGVSVTLESSRFRARPGAPLEEGRATVRLVLDEHGRVEAIEPLLGDSIAVARARAIVPELRFDPALRNGEPVAGESVYTFRFRGGG